MHAEAKCQRALRNFSLFRSNRHAQLILSSNLGIPGYALGCITLGVMHIKPTPIQSRRIPLLIALLFVVPAAADAACNIVNGKAYGDCPGVTVRQGTRPALDIRSHVTESAIVAGAIVYSGGSLHLSGISNGDILVKRGGHLTVTGIVNATIRNEGGIVDVEGTVDNLISSGGNVVVGGQVGNFGGAGPATFKKGAVLRGMPLEQTVRIPRTEPSSAARTR